ncbi:hypothetical protein QET93_003560 [Akkermansia sp. N21116]|jgi:hypothetical protein|uniref:hypothetical protein n=1 Tax=Akkermansia sp. N21116 TaxID=3040764 RepID=UPI00244E8174|nr:hypothetical protein [Akkermansia sp. N21116]WPX41180.1 hypothetical protein QET93_003560 [Akkermansia sp. N21116]
MALYSATVHALAVGQGMGYVLEVTEGWETVFLGLFDFGSINTAKDAQAIEQSARYLASLIRGNKNRLNSLVISHQDEDHHNLLSLIDNEDIIIDHYFYGGASGAPPYTFTQANVKKGPYGLCNWTIPLPFVGYPDKGIRIVELFNIICLSVEKYNQYYDEKLAVPDLINQSSSVVLAKVLVRREKGKKDIYAYFLFPGDATVETIYYIVDELRWFPFLNYDKCHFLSVPHHGASATLLGHFTETAPASQRDFEVFEAFLRDLHPFSAHVSAGYDNQFGHPRSEIKDLVIKHLNRTSGLLRRTHSIYYQKGSSFQTSEIDAPFYTSVSRNEHQDVCYFNQTYHVDFTGRITISSEQACIMEPALQQGKIAARREIPREWKDRQL